MRSEDEIKQYIKYIKSETEHLKNQPVFVENYFYDGYIKALEWVLQEGTNERNRKDDAKY